MAHKVAGVVFNKLILLGFSIAYSRELVAVLTVYHTPFDASTVAFAKFVKVCAERNRIVQYFSCVIFMAVGICINLDRSKISVSSWLCPAFALITMTLALQSILLSSFYISCLNHTAFDRNRASAWIADAHPTMSAGLLNVSSALAVAPALSIWSGLCFLCFLLVRYISESLAECDGQYKAMPTMEGRPVTSAILTGFVALSLVLTIAAVKSVSRLGTARLNAL